MLALLVPLLAAPAAQERPLPDYDSFAVQVKKHLATDEERQSGYMFIENRTEQKLDGAGRPAHESVKVFEVYPGLPGEDRYQRLIEEDGKPVPPAKLAQRDRDRQKEVEAYARRISTSASHHIVIINAYGCASRSTSAYACFRRSRAGLTSPRVAS